MVRHPKGQCGIPLSVRLLSGVEAACVVMQPLETVRKLKRRIQEIEGTPVCQQKLFKGGVALANRQTIADARLFPMDTIQLVKRPLDECQEPALTQEALAAMEADASAVAHVFADDDLAADEPSDNEIDDYAICMGMDLDVDAAYLWIAEACLKAPVPLPWRACMNVDGYLVFVNCNTGERMWDHPCAPEYHRLYHEIKAKPREPVPGFRAKAGCDPSVMLAATPNWQRLVGACMVLWIALEIIFRTLLYVVGVGLQPEKANRSRSIAPVQD